MVEESQSVRLSNGLLMPRVGLGTVTFKDTSMLVNAIVQAGYRHIDTAFVYNNETEIGIALKEVFSTSDIKREDLFIVTKMRSTQQNDIAAALKGSLERLGLSYVDSYLLHWPSHYFVPESERRPLHKIWADLEELVDQGLIKSLGISNFNLQLISDLLCYARHKPVCNQIEIHPYNSQEELVRFLRDQDIVPVAYCPLGRPITDEDKQNYINPFEILPYASEDPRVQEIAKKYGKTEWQVILRWHLQRGIVVIPKSSSVDHQKENLSVFDFSLSEEEI